MTDKPKQLSERVTKNMRRLRRARKWNIEELAAHLTDAGCPVTSAALALREARRDRGSRVCVDELFALARVFDVSVEDLVAEEPQCRQCGGTPPVGFTCNACGEAGDGMAGPQPRQRRLITRPFLEEVAKVYRDAMATQGAPTASVAKHFQAAHSTATKWVMAARSEGVLDPWWTANSGGGES